MLCPKLLSTGDRFALRTSASGLQPGTSTARWVVFHAEEDLAIIRGSLLFREFTKWKPSPRAKRGILNAMGMSTRKDLRGDLSSL